MRRGNQRLRPVNHRLLNSFTYRKDARAQRRNIALLSWRRTDFRPSDYRDGRLPTIAPVGGK